MKKKFPAVLVALDKGVTTKVDVFSLIVKTLEEHGLDAKTIGVWELPESALETLKTEDYIWR